MTKKALLTSIKALRQRAREHIEQGAVTVGSLLTGIKPALRAS